jgi:hypothetical protein
VNEFRQDDVYSRLLYKYLKMYEIPMTYKEAIQNDEFLMEFEEFLKRIWMLQHETQN